MITELAYPGVLVITPPRSDDPRGFFSEFHNRRRLAGMGLDVEFVQDNLSLSHAAGTVRGLHFQKPPHAQGKLVGVVTGRILDVAVDIRTGSPTYGGHVALELGEEGRQLWIPPGFAHGYCTLEPDTRVFYKVTDYYSPADDCGMRWDDPTLGIPWPVTAADATLSEKDSRLPGLGDTPPVFRYEEAARP